MASMFGWGERASAILGSLRELGKAGSADFAASMLARKGVPIDDPIRAELTPKVTGLFASEVASEQVLGTLSGRRTRRNAGMHARSSTTKDLIRYLRQAGQDENVEAWTAQHPSVAAKITAGPFSASYDFVDSHRLKATRWMAERMRREGLALSVENAPVWLFVTKPPSKASGEWNGSLDFTMLKLSVPLGRLLVSFHYPWSKFLQFGDELFVYVTHEEKAAWNCLQPLWEERLKSWDRMFDLSLVEKADLSWGNRLGAESTRREDDMLCLQATTATIGRHDVVEVFSEW